MLSRRFQPPAATLPADAAAAANTVATITAAPDTVAAAHSVKSCRRRSECLN